jgi:N-acyl-D-amino-acid deacylase
MEHVLIHGVTIIDGTGKSRFQGDISFDGDTITEVAPHIDPIGKTVINADGLVASPGFIDAHTHTDRKIFDNPLGDSKVMQGVTTDVTCHCGIGPFPAKQDRLKELTTYLNTLSGSLPSDGITWSDFAGFAAAVEKQQPGINLAMLVSHGALRIASVGLADRPATREELLMMQEMLDTSLQQGAWGMSTGLVYPPGSFADTKELITLAKVLAKHKAVYTSHIRGESATLGKSIEEAITIGRESGVKVLVSHLKAIGKPFWGQGLAALHRIEHAREEGVDIWADQYPYEATATSLLALAPGWAQDGGVNALLERLASPSLRPQLLEAIGKELHVRGGADRVKIAGLKSAANQQWVGKTMQDYATGRQLPVEEAVCQLLTEENATVSAVYFSLGEQDLEGIIKSPNVAVGSDGQAMNPQRDQKESVHPRSYGTFPRVLGRFVREKGMLTLETAISKMTSLPASIYRIPNRGLIKPGYKADLTLFDPETVIDRAEFGTPHQYPVGIPYVVINGTLAVSQSCLTGNGRGSILRKQR